MIVKSDWEYEVEKSIENLWMVRSDLGKFICKKLRGRFFIKDGESMSEIKSVISAVKL